MDLTRLANACRTDKGTVTGLGHGYTLVYDLLFSSRRLEKINFLEIGLCIGGPEVASGSIDRVTTDIPSIRMWHEYFPNANLYGVDISDFSQFETDWFRFIRADCGEAGELQKVADLKVQFDFVIDDGSHAAFHQQQTFLSLFPTLRPGGLYIIEDMQWQPSTYDMKLPDVPRTDLVLNQLIMTGHFSNTGALPLTSWRALEDDIKSVFLIDEDWLYAHRRQYNRRHGLTPDLSTLDDHDNGRRLALPAFWKRLAGRTRSEFQGPAAVDRRPRVKLAIIQKA